MIQHIARRTSDLPHAEDGHPMVAIHFVFDPPLHDGPRFVEDAVLDSRGFYASDNTGHITDGAHRIFPRHGITVADALHGIEPAYEEAS